MRRFGQEVPPRPPPAPLAARPPSLVERARDLAGRVPTPVWIVLGGVAVIYLISRTRAGKAIVSTVEEQGFAVGLKTIMPKSTEHLAPIVARGILQAADRYKMSPFTLASVLKHESNFGAALRPPGTGTGDFIPRPYIAKLADLPGVRRGRADIGTALGDGTTFKGRKGLPIDDALIPTTTGWGFGMAQADWGSWKDWIKKSNWADPIVSIDFMGSLYAANTDFFKKKGLTGSKLDEAVIAAYNAGPGTVWSAITAGKDPRTTTFHADYVDRILASAASVASGVV